MEPMYETFFCPLTKKIMDDPVTIKSGVTFERKAIVVWFEKFHGSEQILCPTTGNKLSSKAFIKNIALKTTIAQWKKRNATARIKVARAALSLASSDAMVLEAVRDVQDICQMRPYNNAQIHRVGILPLLVKCLGEIVLGHDSQTCVAEGASPTLIKMVRSGNMLASRAAFKTIMQLSSYHPNANILVEAGIVQTMVEEMFIRKVHNEPMNSISEAAAILANILESGLEFKNIQVNSHGHTMASDYVVYNILYMLNNSTPDELAHNLIRILLSLFAKIPKPTATIVSLLKETDASYTIIELINNSHEKLSIAAIKLLTVLSPHMGHILAERLCKTRGQPESLLIESSPGTTIITEKQAVSATFLATLPHDNLTLNLALLHKNTVPAMLQAISQIQRRGAVSSRFETSYLEGLVGILVRFTTTLYEHQILCLAKTQNFTAVFTRLLMKTSSDDIQRLSAKGLENLSLESVNLSKPPQIKNKKNQKLFSLPKTLSSGFSEGRRMALCPVHRGACSSQDTFCIVSAKAVEKLLVCLENENPKVVEAALSTISTLLDDKVDVDKSVSMLSEVNAVQHVLNAVKDHTQEGLWQKSFWVLEKLLNKGSGGKSASDISNDRVLAAILVSAFHHGAGNTKQMAEKILRHLNKMP